MALLLAISPGAACLASPQTLQDAPNFSRSLEPFFAELARPLVFDNVGELERWGAALLREHGSARLFGLFQVMYFYRIHEQAPELGVWIAKTRQAAARDHDQTLARVADFFQTCQEEIASRHGDRRTTDWTPFVESRLPEVRLMALNELSEQLNEKHRWSKAAEVAAIGLQEAERIGPSALQVEAELHQAFGDALADMGYSQGAMSHFIQAWRLERRGVVRPRHMERLYALAIAARNAGELDVADRFTRLRISFVGEPTDYWSLFLCAEMAASRQEWSRVLACTHGPKMTAQTPTSQADVDILQWRAMAHAQLGHSREARRELVILERSRLPGTRGLTQDLARIYVEQSEGRDVFSALEKWRRLYDADQAKLHASQMTDVAAGLEAQLRRKNTERDQLAQRVRMARELALTWSVVAVLLAVLTLGGLAWALHLRRMSKVLRLATTRAEAANEAKSRFLANMSHELRTPLNGMLGMAQALAASGLTPDQAEQAQILYGSGHDLLEILNDILDLSKIEADRLEIAPVPSDLAGLCQDIVANYSFAAEAKDTCIVLDCDPAIPASLALDPLRVRQCVSNLVSNAVKFTQSGLVRVTVSGAPDKATGRTRVIVTVADNGMGMSRATLDRLFAAFFQGDSSVTRRFGGTGLGLNITLRLASMMGGGVTAESDEGAGSVFTLTFLADAVRATSAEPAPEGACAPEIAAGAQDVLAGARVLVVDDHPVNRKVAGLLLGRLGCQIFEAENGEVALEHLEAFGADLVLMDVNMPVLDGLEATRRLRMQDRWRALPILALTAGAGAEHSQNCLAAGMDDYLAKPIDAAKLITMVGEHLARATAPPAVAARLVRRAA